MLANIFQSVCALPSFLSPLPPFPLFSLHLPTNFFDTFSQSVFRHARFLQCEAVAAPSSGPKLTDRNLTVSHLCHIILFPENLTHSDRTSQNRAQVVAAPSQRHTSAVPCSPWPSLSGAWLSWEGQVSGAVGEGRGTYLSLRGCESGHVPVHRREDPSAGPVRTGAVLTSCQMTQCHLETLREREGS